MFYDIRVGREKTQRDLKSAESDTSERGDASIHFVVRAVIILIIRRKGANKEDSVGALALGAFGYLAAAQ